MTKNQIDQWNPTPKVCGKFGAPMGRGCALEIDQRCDLVIHLRRVPLDSGGYDAGGAYWGFPNNLYAYGFAGVVTFVRADSREHAKRKIKLRFPNIRFYC